MPPLFRTPGPGVLMCSVLLATFLQALSMSARAEVQVTGGPDAMNVEARDASVEEVLIALKKAYRLQYGSSANLSRSVSGTFAGSLNQVISRVLSLQGYGFIVETSAQGTLVAVYDMSTAPKIAVIPAPKAAAAAPSAISAAASSLSSENESKFAAALKRVHGPAAHVLASILREKAQQRGKAR